MANFPLPWREGIKGRGMRKPKENGFTRVGEILRCAQNDRCGDVGALLAAPWAGQALPLQSRWTRASRRMTALGRHETCPYGRALKALLQEWR